MTMESLGTQSFLDTPTVNGLPVLLNAGGVPSLQAGSLAARPAAGTVGKIYLDTDHNTYFRDTGTNWVTISGAVYTQITAGEILQQSGTTTVPIDSTVPTSTEGFEILNVSFTPNYATSTIAIELTFLVSVSTAGSPVCSIFANGNNISTTAIRCGTANVFYQLTQYAIFQPGSTAPITFSVRVGSQSGTVYINKTSSVTFGNASVSYYSIREVLI